jgi:hypothetical protein
MYGNFINTNAHTMKKNLIIISVLLAIATLYSYYFGFNDTTTIKDVVIATCVISLSALIVVKHPKAIAPYVHYINAFVIISLANTIFTIEITIVAIFIMCILVCCVEIVKNLNTVKMKNED